MLLIELIKVFSSQLNINEEDFNVIICDNNIKVSQRLTLEKKEKKDKTENKEKGKEKEVQISTPLTSNEDLTNKVKEKRSRGRPRKQCNVITDTNSVDDDVNYEIVRKITYNNKDYYKTEKGALLDTDYNVQGVIVDGIALMK
jgi:hypothetical protein